MIISIIKSALSICSMLPNLSNTFDKWFKLYSIEPVANTIVKIAKTITQSNSEQNAINKLKSEPVLLANLEKLIITTEKELELEIIRDKQNARNRDIAYINTGKRNLRADIMVLAAALGLVLCLTLIAWFRKDIPGEIIGIISTVAGIFGSCLKDAYSFEFGSSRGSKEKDQTVASILSKLKE